MSVSHPDLPKEELDKLTGYKHKMQGKMGKWFLWKKGVGKLSWIQTQNSGQDE